jgi:hypothetical protein
MIHIRKGNPKLVEAIVASFHEPAETSRRKLASFAPRDWERTEFWLDASGLALYFMQHAEANDLTDAIDSGVLARLRAKRQDNRARTTAMMDEFAVLNRALLNAGARFANLKGLTLAPHSFPDPALRHQSDYDFLVDPADTAQACAVLEQHGFALNGFNSRSLEFKKAAAGPASLAGQYRAGQARSAELHIAMESIVPASCKSRDERLDRVVAWHSSAGTFPALSPADRLIGQALHLLGHLRNENTRPSWLLEFRNHILFRSDDHQFWIEVRNAARGNPDIALALGLSKFLATELFGPLPFEEFDVWTVHVLPARVRYWAQTYGRRAVLADVPGTKLYLLLNAAIRQDTPAGRQTESRQLFPMSLPLRVAQPPSKETPRLRIKRELDQLDVIWLRLRFHLSQGALYAIEAFRWNRRWSAVNPSTCNAEGCRNPRPVWQEPHREAHKLSDNR